MGLRFFSPSFQSVFGIAGLALSTLAVLSTAMVLPARAISINDQAAANAGGISNYYDSTNQYPFVAAIVLNGTSNCTGTLINSRTILTAAHCFFSNGVFDGGPTTANPGNPILTISFGPIATVNNPANNDRTVTSIVTHAQFGQPGDEANDIAILSLSAPVTSINPVTLFTSNMAAPAVGSEITMVGYGGNGTGSSCCNPIDNKRRMALSALAGYMPRNQEEPGSDVTQPFYYAQFRNPLSPNNPNKFGLTAPVGPLEGATVGGDSGGPLFVTINGRLVQIGELRGGGNPVGPDSQYGDVNDWTPVQLYTEWLALNNPLRSLSNKSGNFNWSNADAWTDSVPGIVAGTPDNTAGNVTNYQTDLAHYYNVTVSNPGTVTVDMNATVDSVVVNGAQSMLVLPTGFTLTTEVGTGIANGTLLMAGGTLAAPNVLLTGGLLAGAGTVTGTAAFGNVTSLINNGGTVAPLGTLMVEGNFTQIAGTTQFRGTAAGQNDLLAVTGTAALGGTAAAVVLPGLYNRTTSYTFLGAGTVNGRFANLASSSPFFTTSATYGANAVSMTLTRTNFGQVAGLSANQQSVGNALEGGYSTALTGNLATAYSNLLAAQSTQVLNQLSGEAGPASTQSGVVATTQFMNTMFDSAFDSTTSAGGGLGFAAEAGAMGYAAGQKLSKQAGEAYAAVTPRDRFVKAPDMRAYDTRWNVWGSVYGGYSRTTGDSSLGSNTTSSRVYGVVGGADYKVGPDTRVGFAVGGSGTSYSIATGLGGGSSDIFHMGVYAKHNIGAAYLAGGLSYAWQDVSTERTVSLGGNDTLRASFDAHAFAARLEGGWRFATPYVGIAPYAAVQSTTFFMPSYGETSASGSNLFALNYASHNVTATRGELGARWDKMLWANNSSVLTFKARTAWAHDWNGNRSATATFQSLPGTSSFTVNGGTPSDNAMLLSLGASLKFGRGWTALASYEGEYSSNSASNGGKGTIKYEW